jgi:hypothetical protein
MPSKRARNAKSKSQHKNLTDSGPGFGAEIPPNPRADDPAENRPGGGFDKTLKEHLADERLENIGFVVELFLDRRRQVRLTQALQVKSAEGEAWEGWDESRLIDFFVKQASLRVPEPAQRSLDRSEARPDSEGLKTLKIFLDNLQRDFALLAARGRRFDLCVNRAQGLRAFISCEGETIPVEIPRALLRELGAETLGSIMTALSPGAQQKMTAAASEARRRVVEVSGPEVGPASRTVRRKAEVISSRSGSPCRVLQRGDPFKLRFPLEQAAQNRKDSAVRYTATVSAVMWEDRSRRTLCQKTGVVEKGGDSVLIDIAGQELPPGVYRFLTDMELDFEKSAPVGRDTLSSGFVQVV